MKNPFPFLRGTDYAIGALLTLCAIALHLVLHANAGAPWRDEVSAIAVASLPTLGDVWNSSRHDSFPMVYYVLLHFWSSLFGTSTESIRALGLGIGGLSLVGFWWLAHRLRIGSPLLVLAMVAMSAAVIRYGDSARAYGLGLITATLMIGAIWSLLSDCSKKNIAVAMIACLAAAHTSYQNSLLLLALGSAAILAAAFTGRWRLSATIATICATTAASVMIYLPALGYTKSLTVMFKWSVSARDVFSAFGATVATGYGDWQQWVWLVLVLVAMTIALLSLLTAAFNGEVTERRETTVRSLFITLAVPLLIATYVAFMILSDYAVRPWYLLPLMLALAAFIEAGISLLPDMRVATGVVRQILALVIGIAALVNAPADLKRRATNLPELIATIEREGGPGDLVVLTEWYTGLTFNYVYRGEKEWMTIPDLGANSVHRWDKLKTKMQDVNGISGELDRIERALYAGHRVFVIGGFQRISPQQVRIQLPPAPHPRAGWESGIYTGYWAAQAGALLSSTATRAKQLQAPGSPDSVMYWENYPLLVFSRTQ